jgi:hypothetical protein
MFSRRADECLRSPAVAATAPIVSARHFWRPTALKNPLFSVAAFDNTPVSVELRDEAEVIIGGFHTAHWWSPSATGSAWGQHIKGRRRSTAISFHWKVPATPAHLRSDSPGKLINLNERFWDDLSECALMVFNRRNPSKLNTRVRFPSPAPKSFHDYSALRRVMLHKQLNAGVYFTKSSMLQRFFESAG